MKQLKAMITGPAGRFGLGVAIGVIVTRIVDGNPMGSAIAFGLVAGIITMIVHGAVSRK